jgi:hypothetical protein
MSSIKHSYEDFIGVFDNVYDEDFCLHLIEEFDRLENDRVGGNRQQLDGSWKHLKDDYSIHANLNGVGLSNFKGQSTKKVFYDGLQECYDLYTEEFSVLQDHDIHCANIKLQKTSEGGGYHIWHHEQGNGRALVYTLYLNTLDPQSCGETEFLYQGKRFSPVSNRMILWPAGFTHPHRGNPVYGKTSKYIATGWFLYE